jgi:LysM repeat protein
VVTAQPAKPASTSPVEPGLEKAVNWKWRAVPSDPNAWGLELPTMAHLASATPAPSAAQPQNQHAIYEVKRGDALFLIGRRFGVSVDQIKQANGLASDLIRAGQTLRIPPAPRATATHAPSAAKAKPASSLSDAELDQVRLQVFLDREQFSPGPISGRPGPAFGKVSFLYQSSHDDAKDDAALQEKAKAAVGRFLVAINSSVRIFDSSHRPKRRRRVLRGHPRPASPRRTAFRSSGYETAPNYDQLVASPMLAYRSPWEFVAERFHCSEAYLRTLNGNLPQYRNRRGFRVPNVIPLRLRTPSRNRCSRKRTLRIQSRLGWSVSRS